MRKMFFFVLAAAALLLMVPTQNAQAQSETPKVEIGAHYTLLRLRDFDTTDNGIGTRVTFNLADSLSVEGELNFFPQGRPNFAGFPTDNSKRTQGLFGVKYGMRSEKAGIYGKFRPGFMRFSEGDSIPGLTSSRTEFAFDFGGVFELYPSRHLSLRFDVGDTVIRFSNPIVVTQPVYTNNLQISTGVGFRF
jgi:hypothetical protein